VIAAELKEGAASETVTVKQVPPDKLILDVGPGTVENLATRIRACSTVVWNGPLGAFETPPFDEGTNAVARAVAERTKEERLVSVAGGGDTVAALANAGVLDDFTYVSTAGGAFLEWLEGKTLPGIAALMEAGASDSA
jgi:phosphoglycerate kinase